MQLTLQTGNTAITCLVSSGSVLIFGYPSAIEFEGKSYKFYTCAGKGRPAVYKDATTDRTLTVYVANKRAVLPPPVQEGTQQVAAAV